MTTLELKNLLFAVFFLLCAIPVFAQPENNECSGAISLPSHYICELTFGNNFDATQSIPAIICNSAHSAAANDVWYSFVANNQNTTVKVIGYANFDPVIDVRSGSCNGTSIGCDDDTGPGGTDSLNLTGLTVGATYLVRVYSFSLNSTSYGIFGICVVDYSPVNDHCENATLLYSSSQCEVDSATTIGATQSTLPLICSGFQADQANDVWFKFEAVSTSHNVYLYDHANYDGVLDVRLGSCPGVSIACADASINDSEMLMLTGLTIGEFYYIRTYDFSTGGGNFSICVTTVPRNDECSGAIGLLSHHLCEPTIGNNFEATQSIPAIICGSTHSVAANDVWYRFVASNTNITVKVDGFGSFDPVIDVRSGACNGTNIACEDETGAGGTDSINLTDLTVGATYLVRVYSFSLNSVSQGNFSICVTDYSPVNDQCANATLLYSSFQCELDSATTIGASQSLPPLICSGFQADQANDVWFKFEAVSTSHNVTLYDNANYDGVLDVRLGACPGVSIACADASINDSEMLMLTGLTVGAFYYIRTYDFSGGGGNFSICVETVFVPCTMTCPPNVTIACNASTLPVSPNGGGTGVPALSNCSANVTVSYTDSTSPGSCSSNYTITRTWHKNDPQSESNNCTQTITVRDITPPVMSCPQGLTFQCAGQVPTASTQGITATDNCSGATISIVGDFITNQICSNRFTINRVYRAMDGCGNSATCTQIIIVNDNVGPTITCPGSLTFQCAAQVPAANTTLVSATDNCSGAASISYVGDAISGQTCVNKITITRFYRATDACGNSTSCSQTIIVNDTTAPSIQCPGNVTVQCAALVPVVNIAAVVTADNCSGTPTVTFVSDVISNTICLNRFIVTRTYRSTDICGNSATCVQIIVVNDNMAPVITFTESHIANLANGGRFDVQCFGQDPAWDLPVLDESSVSVSDNCAGTVTVGFSQLLFDEGNCPVDGYITMYKLTWTATDACGNSSTKFVFMALVDHIAPVLFNIPNDITVNCDEIPEPPTNVYATDECISASNIQYSATPVAPGCQDGQVITRKWIATDLCGNKTTETQSITLVDDTPPVMQMLEPGLAGVSDGDILKYTCEEGGIPDFFDDLNAESVYGLPSCGSGATIRFDKNTVHSVNCKRAGYLEQQTFHWVGTDNCGNAANLTIIAQVVDTEGPTITGVPDIACIDDPVLKFVDAIDNCDDPYLQYWDVKMPNPCGPGFAIRRTYEAYDHCANSSRDTAILIPNDHLGPLMTFVNPKLAELKQGEVLLIDCEGKEGDYTPYGVDDISVQDGCSSEVVVTFVEKILESNGCQNGIVATLSLEWTATDICGNVSKKTAQAFVVDHTPPVLVNFKSEVKIGCNDDPPAINATDNCGTVTIAIDESVRPGPCNFIYDITRNILVTDACGNTAMATQIVHVGDGRGPVISGVIPGLCDDLSIPKVTAYDPCADKYVDVTMTEKQLDSGCKEGKVFKRTWSATDGCGNVSTAVQIIILDDHTAPVIQIPTWSIILKYLDAVPGTNYVKLSQTSIMDKLDDLDDGSVYVEDECDEQVVPEFTLEVSYAEDCEADGYFEHRVYTWTTTDVCGNVSSISFDVYIVDDVAPLLLGVPGDATYICVPLPSAASISSNDPAQPVTIVYNSNTTPAVPLGVNVVRTWTGTDACGNISVATQKILWIADTNLECDVNVPALVECNSHSVVISGNVTGGLGDYTYKWEVIGPGFIQSGQGTDQISIYVGWTTVVVKLTVRDAYGCETQCSAVIDCIDTAINPFAATPPVNTPGTVVDPNMIPTSDQDVTDRLSGLHLWPNPTNNSVNLSFDSPEEQTVQFRLINFLGREMMMEKMNVQKGINTRKLDVSLFPEGSYMMDVKTDSGVYTKVVVIMRK